MTTTGAKSTSTLILALALFGLAGSVVMVTVPRLFPGPGGPGFAIFLVAGVTVIALTAGLFGYVYGLGMGFGGTVLVLAAGYNALIAAVKLGLAPAALYQANREEAFEASISDPNSLWFFLGIGSGVLLLYLLVFGVMYRVFRRRFRRRSLPSLSYLAYIFSTFGAAILLALILAAFLAYRTFEEVEKRAVRLGDATLLASFFWLGMALIVLYHVMWVVFLFTLVSIWPFRTYTPK